MTTTELDVERRSGPAIRRGHRRPARRQRSGMARMELRWGLLMVAPAVVGFMVFIIGPMLASFVIGMTDWTIGASPHFVGMQNFKTMLTDDPLFWSSAGATLYYAMIAVPLTLVVGFAAALLLNQSVRGRGFFRTLFYLPVLVPSVASAILWIWIYNPDFGLLNSILRQAGLPTSQWIYGAKTAIPSLAIMAAWGFGSAATIFLAGLQGIPQHLYEAVGCDGGNAWHKLRYVTLPMMTPTILYNLVMGLIAAFQVFNEAYLMTEGGPGNTTLFWVFYIYRTAFTESRFGYACALSWGLFVIIAVVTLLVFRTARRWVFYSTGDNA